MRNVLVAVIIGFGSLAAHLPSTANAEVLDHTSDISAIKAELSKIEQTASQYGEGLITNVLAARKETLQLSLDALNFFKLSTTDGVVREYTIELTKPDPQRAEAILAEILKQKDEIAQAEIEAAESGGLIQVLALTRVETEKLTLSQLQLGYFQAKYGLPIRSKTNLPNATTVEPEAAPASDQSAESEPNGETSETLDSALQSPWNFSEQTDDFSDKETSFAYLEPTSTVRRDDPKTLVVRCNGEGGYDVYMIANGYIGSTNDRIKVRYRFGKGKSVTERWNESADGKAAFLPGGYNDFRTLLKTGEDFVFEITDYKGSPANSQFDNSKDENLDYVMSGCIVK